MNADKIFDLLTTEIITELRLPRDLYSKFIRERIEWAYAAGHDKGRVFYGHSKEVIQLTLEGRFIKSWQSPVYAAKALGVDRTTISKCAKKKKHHLTSAGFKWEYGEEYYARVAKENFAHVTEELINQYNQDSNGISQEANIID